MRFLQTNDFSLVEYTDDDIPPYAILSHVWGDEEVLYDDVQMDGKSKNKRGFRKLKFCQKQAVEDGLEFFWIDTCCIDRSSSSELSEAVNSMFDWYRNADKCYVYLTDVTSKKQRKEQFCNSNWFNRSWTLLELLAPRTIEFFNLQGASIGDRTSLLQDIEAITTIPRDAIQHCRIFKYSVAERLAWAGTREATHEEDKAYSLLGIFKIRMPLMYGEGRWRAFARLESQLAESLKPRESKPLLVIPKPATDPGYTSPPLISTSKPTMVVNFLDDPQLENQGLDYSELPPKSSFYLPLAKDRFRVLILNPGAAGSVITGHIEEHDLKRPPPYNALSYVWGQEPAVHRVLFNNEVTFIRPNLYHALQRIRALQSIQIHLWVDTLCINQSHAIERNAQVREMANIYNKAEGVYIWLGEEDSTSKLAIELIEEIHDQKFSWTGLWWDNYGITALGRLLERPWFRRGWVLQEAAFSTNSIIQCGDRQVYMNHFSKAIRSVRERISDGAPAIDRITLAPRAENLANFFDSPAVRMLDVIEGAFERLDNGQIDKRKMTLETLVHLATFSETSDQRDAIYSLLNMASDTSPQMQSESGNILPDYTKNILEVYEDFVLYCCSRSDSLDVICRPWAPSLQTLSTFSREDGGPGPNFEGLPSWISLRDNLPHGNPSRQSIHRIHGVPLVGGTQKRVYNTHNGTQPRVTVKAEVTLGSLFAQGVILAKIAESSTRLADAIITSECLEILGTISRTSHSGRINLPDCIWRTLCADRNGRGDPAPSSYRIAMLELLEKNLDDAATDDTTDVLDHMTSIDIEELLEDEQLIPERIREFLIVVRDTVWNRRTFWAKKTGRVPSDLVGLIPQRARFGDFVCVLYGCSVPVILRRYHTPPGRPYWRLLGDAYVDGIMNGELFQEWRPEFLQVIEEDFELQ